MSAPHGLGETAAVYRLCQLFAANPKLHYHSIVIHESGRIEVAVDGGTGIVHDWCCALPERRETAGLAKTPYGATEAVVLTQDVLTVTIRPSFVGGA